MTKKTTPTRTKKPTQTDLKYLDWLQEREKRTAVEKQKKKQV